MDTSDKIKQAFESEEIGQAYAAFDELWDQFPKPVNRLKALEIPMYDFGLLVALFEKGTGIRATPEVISMLLAFLGTGIFLGAERGEQTVKGIIAQARKDMGV